MWDGLVRRLEGSLVVLEPLAAGHEAGLWEAAQDPLIWRWLNAEAHTSRDALRAWLDEALANAARGSEGPFAVVERASGEPVGSSRFLTLQPEHLSLEIGYTWYARRVWGTGVNVETKLLLLEHAFERLGCRRVEFKTDARNERSRGALAALPAQFEGVLRKHRVLLDGGRRDSAYFSVIDDEWPAVRANLERRLGR